MAHKQSVLPSMENAYSKNFARFYDHLYKHLRDGVDNLFYLEAIQQCDEPCLEVGTGTGRFFMEALKSGANIYGIDICESMLEVLKAKVPSDEHYRISNQDIRTFQFPFHFQLVIAPFRVFMHLESIEDQMKALQNVWKSLKPGGQFIFDLFIPQLPPLINGLNKVVDFEGEHETGKKLRRIVSTQPDLIHQLLHITFELEWEESQGVWVKDIWNTQLRYFFRYELEHLLARSPFSSWEIMGNFNREKLNPESKEFIVICKK